MSGLNGRQRTATMSSTTRRATASLAIEHVGVETLVPDVANPRRIADAELEALTRSIQQFGLVDPIIACRADKRVVGGHQRLVAARRLGLKTVPVIFLDISEEQASLLNLALNKIQGTWDEDLLARLLADLGATADADLALSGFSDDEVQRLLRRLDARERRDRPESFDVDAALDAAEKQSAETQPGDLWRLGPHTLMCGDATNSEHVARLLNGTKAAMAFCDPPYGVRLGDHGGQTKGQRKRRLENDALTGEVWDQFCRAWAQHLAAGVDGAVYIAMSTKEWPTVSRVLAEAGIEWSTTIVWKKDAFVLGRGHYHQGFEPIFYGRPQGAKWQWHGGRKQSNVWEIPRPQASPLHPTMKPLSLIERALENSSRPGDTVLDLFLGSGTTLIACERTGRIGQGMEIDPRYVMVAIARWHAFGGEAAVRS